MLFSSWKFLFVFLPVVLIVFLMIPSRFGLAKKGWLLIASLVFYGAWRIDALPLMIGSILFNYGVAECLTRNRDRKWSFPLVIFGISANLLLLGYYKYAGFFLGIAKTLTHSEFDIPSIILPLAISFFTFTQLAYIIDVYRDPTRHYRFLDYSLFVVFFPHLIAGPIVRHWEIIPQYVDRVVRPSIADFHVGAVLFLTGLFKKCLIADPLAQSANAIFDATASGVVPTFFDAWFGALAYTLQLYFDFSGYSDMAIGLARIYGIRFPCNFNSPYQALSVSDFWSRWHITLTRFLREYLYFPLGGNRAGPFGQAKNIMIVMLVSGLWHGAGWTFVCWGALHGAYLVIASLWSRVGERLHIRRINKGFYRFGCRTVTFLAVLLAWILFRASDFETAGRLYSSIFGINGFSFPYEIGEAKLGLGRIANAIGGSIVPSNIPGISYRFSVIYAALALFGALFLPNIQSLMASRDPILEPIKKPSMFQPKFGFLAGLGFGILLLLVIRSFFAVQESPFLYFNF